MIIDWGADSQVYFSNSIEYSHSTGPISIFTVVNPHSVFQGAEVSVTNPHSSSQSGEISIFNPHDNDVIKIYEDGVEKIYEDGVTKIYEDVASAEITGTNPHTGV